jgi:hypothetical protein
MSYKYGSSLVPGAYHYGGGGLGVLGSAVPSSGDNGPGYLYNDLSLPADASKEVRGLIETFPVGLSTFDVFEDSSFTASGPDGVYTFTYRLYVDGVDSGTAVGTISIGVVSSGALTGGITLDNLVAAGTLASSPSVLSGGITLDDLTASGSLGQAGALSGGVTLDNLVAGGTLSSGVLAEDSRFIISHRPGNFRDRFQKYFKYPKDPAEQAVLTFDFTWDLDDGEYLVGTPTVTLVSFEDPVADIANGAAALDAVKPKYRIPVRAGIDGATYWCKVVFSTSNPSKTVAITGGLRVLEGA